MKYLLSGFLAAIYLSCGSSSRGQGIDSTSVSLNQFSDQSTLDRQTQSQDGETGPRLEGGALPATPSIPTKSDWVQINPAWSALSPETIKQLDEYVKNPSRVQMQHIEELGKKDDVPITAQDIGTAAGAANKPEDFIYSGFKNGPKPLPFITQTQWYSRETFSEKNSFLGTGVVDTFGTDTGVDVLTRTGFKFEPDFGYKYGTRDLSAPNAMYSDGYVGQLNFSQKIFPLVAMMKDQPGATYNLRDATTADVADPTKDIFPNFDIVLGLNTQFTALDQVTLTKGKRVKGTQDFWDLAPSVTFEFNITQDYVIQLLPSWDDTMSSTSTDQSSSGGTMQIQLRNQYTHSWDKVRVDDKHDLNRQSFILTQYNALLHDTNLEPLPTAPMPVAFQNWAKFGLSAIYKKLYNDDLHDPRYIQLRVEYAYEAFNAAYESHTVIASVNVDF